MKFTRDWEYPWTLLRAEAGPGRRLLDCGAGYSPLPFLWAARGATVHAIDRDALVASVPRYLVWCATQLIRDLEAELRGRSARQQPAGSTESPAARRPVDARQYRPHPSAPRSRSRLARFARFHLARNRERLARVVKPDFWGPVSPRLLRKYGIHYLSGDMTELPFDAGEFDAVSCVSVLEHLPRAARIAGVREMARVARRGGRVIITYDVVDGDITQEIVDATGGTAIECVYFHASKRLYADGAPDVIGVVITMPE